ncbi:glycoside hydrolase family 35 protein [Cylindrobasidium torrendii FP15055 ss-10]|uniref:beta-galactosidase n=1 Tax=Cylindrobasidium torrendii FP15055 ss-10 TaxID=1314674 RepID=A0A0D7AZZ9_9AGAR|nr:glycoside hydrolase family 35 protein [Cylindrobasidium torrendii FP15055 ss-10]
MKLLARLSPLALGLTTAVHAFSFDLDVLGRAPSYTDLVSFDNYSLSLLGQRLFLHSGEFHTYRLPVPDLWPDILQKVKAAGFNSLSIYTHMGSINPAPGVIDFDGYRALKPLYEAAKEAGIWLVMRPGPYINAEISAGGLAHWLTSEVAGTLRTNATDFHDSWVPYIQGFIDETAPYQITEGGPVIAVQIDNEYSQKLGAEFFQELIDYYHASDIVVPLTYNDPGQNKNFINGTGAVDLYGIDYYPQLFDCSNPYDWKPLRSNYLQYHLEANPSQPHYSPEFQGGAFDAWGPTAPGYDSCATLTGPDFMDVFYKHMWASNAKLMSYYMIYGGTSWGAMPFPGVYTSYDYGATISENRVLRNKYGELKRQGFFIRSSPDFYKTQWLGDTLNGLKVGAPEDTFVTHLLNPDTQAGFYILRHNDSASRDNVDVPITIQTSAGPIDTSIVLDGRQSKIILADYKFGASSSILYSTAQVYFAGVIDDRDVILLYGDEGQDVEFAIDLVGENNAEVPEGVSITEGNTTVVSVSTTTGLLTIHDSDAQLVLFADTETATGFFAPTIPDATADFGNFWSYGTNNTVLVGGGPYLVRTASIDGETLVLTGDLNTSTTATIIAPASVQAVKWNGVDLEVSASNVSSKGALQAALPFAGLSEQISLPTLGGWKYRDSLPEITTGYDDSAWTIANKTQTNIPQKPLYGDGRVLYGCDYGFCENIVLWRGHFNSTGEQKSVNLSINGGQAYAATVWLNDVFLNTSYGNSTNNRNPIEERDLVFNFPEGALVDGDNVITVVQDNMGLNETNGGNPNSSKGPRGIRGFQLDSGNFSDWKVQGKVGGYTDFPDKKRGVMNEGGLFGERAGWHLPGYDTSEWEERDLSQGLAEGKAGVGFFVTTFDLDIPEGVDAPISLTFEEELGAAYRVYLFVNGWMMGKRVANLGPQYKFPVHEGILDYHGTNTVAVALWAMEDEEVSPTLALTLDAVFEGGVGEITIDNPQWEATGREVE